MSLEEINFSHPWKMNKSRVEIVKTYDAWVTGEGKKKWEISYFKKDCSVADSRLSKKRFNNLPYPVHVGSHFWIVFADRIDDKRPELIWPVVEYWHKSWKEC